ncbi:MAG TPA: tetratricopeptide repeat protein, partial [Sulfurospirillum arcachonense]|nr:tetratricopeptide repeat protein [Sulfurospirillum arcachonense]
MLLNFKNKQILKKLITVNNFRFLVILYYNSNQILEIKNYIKNEYLEVNTQNLALVNKNTILKKIKAFNNGFIFIDDLNEVLDDSELSALFNQRRDTLAKLDINFITFYPYSLEDELYKKASKMIPDFWEFRSPLVRLEISETTKINHNEISVNSQSSSYSSLGGFNTKDKKKEISRLEKLVDLGKDTLDRLDLNRIEQLGKLYNEVGEYAKALPLYEKALTTHQNILGEEHPSTATSYNNLAALYESMGEYAKALPLYEKALKIRQ